MTNNAGRSAKLLLPHPLAKFLIDLAGLHCIPINLRVTLHQIWHRRDLLRQRCVFVEISDESLPSLCCCRRPFLAHQEVGEELSCIGMRGRLGYPQTCPPNSRSIFGIDISDRRALGGCFEHVETRVSDDDRFLACRQESEGFVAARSDDWVVSVQAIKV